MRENIVYFLVFLLLCGSSPCFAESSKKITKKNCSIKHANSLLFHAENDLKLLKYCRENISDNKELITKVEESLFKKLSEISSISPSLDELGGTPLNVIASILNYQSDNLIHYSGPYKNEIVHNYLTSIANSLIEQDDKYGKLPTTPLIKFYKNNKKTK